MKGELMKKYLLIGVVGLLLLTGCGGKKADITCTASLDQAGIKMDGTYYAYLTDGKVSKVEMEIKFEDEATAKEADSRPEVEEAVKNGSALDHKVNGKYLIATMPESLYSALTVEQLKATAETLEKAINNAMEQQKEEYDVEIAFLEGKVSKFVSYSNK